MKAKSKNKSSRKQKIKKYSYGSFISKFAYQYYKEWFKKNTKISTMFLVIMQMRNGKYNMMTVVTSAPYFKYLDGEYYIDPDMARDDVHSGLSTLFYHQDSAIPFRINFNMTDLRKGLHDNAADVEKAINPQNLRSFIHSQVVEKVLKGQELSDDIKFLRMIVIIIALIVAGIGFMFARSMGYI